MSNKEKPILFNTEMVRAVLDGRKTQTRRVIKTDISNALSAKVAFSEYGEKSVRWDALMDDKDDFYYRRFRCPYGKVGDRLWVRESWADVTGAFEDADDMRDVAFKADDSVWNCYGQMVYLEKLGDSGIFVDKWKPSIHMPKWASRITLEITDIRVERIQDITETDAEAEGIECFDPENDQAVCRMPGTDKWDWNFATDVFRELWDSINEKRGYSLESNPFVWVIEFKKL